MLLNYLYENFLEERRFCEAVSTTCEQLNSLIQARVFPAPSYIYQSKGNTVSFVSDFSDNSTYWFHLCGHKCLYKTTLRLDLNTEERARQYFFGRYNQAKTMFIKSDLAKELTKLNPDVPAQFDTNHANSTWNHFLNGVYGVCTRDGQPESIFLKQVSVMFIERMTVQRAKPQSNIQLELLRRIVEFLDAVESEFAPHEVPETSRQRCIIDVKARYFGELDDK